MSIVNRFDEYYCQFICLSFAARKWAMFANVRQFILARRQVSFGFDSEFEEYFADDKTVGRIYFGEKYRHLRMYSRGLDRRLERLANDYALSLVPLVDDDVVVDCGANIGELGRYFESSGLKLRYFAFEPSLGEYKFISKNVERVEAFNIGLFNKAEELTFYLASSSADSSLIEPQAYEAVERVEVQRLDAIPIPTPIKLLKLEAEGAEPEVLQGAEAMLGSISYIAADLGAERGVSAESTYQFAIGFLVARGFSVVFINNERMTILFKNEQQLAEIL